ncbi:MAG: GNAT family N-acetyltransferase [Dactylosporangium sp.]|nr:GNAT family N-acetyltransferase [Dactylosporangium sp.]NNJ61339.1 GNAT family N-acetyltransferase [Dactylosporangium sp.]
MSGEVRIGLASTATVRLRFEEICELYDEAFSAAPFYWRDDESRLHRQRLESLLADPSFGAALAFREDTLIGFAYGFALKPDTSWWSGLTPPVPDDEANEWPGRTFVLFDFAVRRDQRGQGVGHGLHDLLLGNRPESRATLATQPAAAETKGLYERWGWRLIGQAKGGPQAAAPLFDIYRRDRIDDLNAGQPSSR